MTKTHITKREARRAARAKRKLYTRIITIGIIVLASAVVILLAMNAINTQKAASLTATQTAASAASNSIPTPGGPTPELVGTKQYSAAPPMLIDVTKQYLATVKLAKGGEFVIQLYPDKAPITVNSFVFLARQGYYDGVTFHRVIEGFMAQTGDPTGTGSGTPGYSFANEANDLAFDKAGVVAMANTGQPISNGSQFFIMFGPYSLNESDYTIFGQVISGMDVVNGITRRDPTQNPTFTGDAIESITITEK
jgi:peptidylprolyl isomerase